MIAIRKYLQFFFYLGFEKIINYNFIFFIQRLLGFLLIFLLANNMSKVSYGEFAYFITIQFIIVELSHLGLLTIIIKKITQNLNKRNDLVYGVIIFSFIFSSIACLTFFFTFKFLNFNLNANNYSLIIVFILTSINYVFVAIFTSINKVVLAHFYETVFKILIVLLLVFLFIFYQKLNLQNLVYAYIFSNILILIIFFYLFYKSFIKKYFFDKINFEFKNYFYSIFFLGISSIILLLNTKVDILMLDYFLGKEKVASYSIGSQISFIGYLSILSMYAVLTPKISIFIKKNKFNLINFSIVFYRSFIFFIVLIIFVFFYFFLKKLIIIFFGSIYLDAYLPAIILSFFYILLSPFIFSDIILKLSGNEKKVSFCALGSACINVFFNLLLIPKYGISGAAISTGLSVLFMHFFCFFLMPKKLFFLFLLIKFLLSKKKFKIKKIVSKFFI